MVVFSRLLCSLACYVSFLAATDSFAVKRASTRIASPSDTNSFQQSHPSQQTYHFLPPAQALHPGSENDLQLLDIALVASVDGKFHAVNRASGQILWSMSSSGNSGELGSNSLAPLVRTEHADLDPVHDAGEQRELYIIEPQSGDIFILPASLDDVKAPLQRLPFTMQQLVDMSPFSFNGDEEHRIFVGKKETSLLVLELETGKVKGSVTSECPWDWDPFGEWSTKSEKHEIDLDELEGSKPPRMGPVSTEVQIGRTDYTVQIHTRSKDPSEPRPPTQTLIFSTYGPNNQDNALQASYHRSPDDTYIQPMVDGEVMAFRTATGEAREPEHNAQAIPVWGNTFKNPVVAVFDILRTPGRANPVALLQPKPRLQDFIPGDFASSNDDNLNMDLEATYIGLVEETRSLFALSPERYPLVVFSPPNFNFLGKRLATIDAPPDYVPNSDAYSDSLASIDSIPRLLKEQAKCTNGRWERECVVGKRPVAADSQSRLSRLLPDRPHESLPSLRYSDAPVSDSSSNYSGEHSAEEIDGPGTVLGWKATLSSGAFACLIFLVGMWYLSKPPMDRKAPMNSTMHQPKEEAAIHTGDYALPLRPEATGSTADDFVIIPSPVTFSEQHPFPIARNPPLSLPAAPTASINGSSIAIVEDDSEAEEQDQAEVAPGKKKGTRRRRRGKKNRGDKALSMESKEVDEVPDTKSEEEAQESQAADWDPQRMDSQSAQLIVSEDVLGYGSHGTVVYRGSLQGRAVAVKRLLKDFVTLHSREVALLQDSDDHPNVIRYYYQESHPSSNFLYIALELCPASLADVIEHPDQHRELSNSLDPKRALKEVTAGLRHLHALKIVHRDIKPQNILVSAAKAGAGSLKGHRMLISDFGLCKKLEVDQTSFAPTFAGQGAAGTSGWRAPEILRGEVNVDEPPMDDSTLSSKSSVGTATADEGYQSSSKVVSKGTRLTKAVDIFALGCLAYYVLTSGGHPYGDRFERDVNIIKDAKSLEGLESFGEEGLEAIDLITKMLDSDATKRPDTSTTLAHPFFWNSARRLAFLQDASDRFEIMCRNPREPDLNELERGAHGVVGNDWQSRLDRVFLENLGKFRKYDGKSVQDLMRALRNKKHHYQDLPDNVKRHLGSLPDGFLGYFTRRFPHLFMHVHGVVARTNLRYESMFGAYFDSPD